MYSSVWQMKMQFLTRRDDGICGIFIVSQMFSNGQILKHITSSFFILDSLYAIYYVALFVPSDRFTGLLVINTTSQDLIV